MPITWMLMLGAVIAPFLTYGYAVAVTKHKVRAEERAVCVVKIRNLEADINAKADAKIAEAIDAAKAESPTPATAAELVALCQKSPTCRDKKP